MLYNYLMQECYKHIYLSAYYRKAPRTSRVNKSVWTSNIKVKSGQKTLSSLTIPELFFYLISRSFQSKTSLSTLQENR